MKHQQKALVIGGSGRLGSEVCHRLLAKEYDVAITYNAGIETADSIKREWAGAPERLFTFHLDLNEIDNTKKVVRDATEALGRLDSLIICSGIASAHRRNGRVFVPRFLDISPEGYDQMMSVNIRGVFFACQEAVKIMRNQSAGKIIIVGSIDGIKPEPSPVDYACSKAALWGMTQSLAKEVGKDNILVNFIAPGILEGGVANLLSEELMAEYLKHCSLKRVGRFEEVAAVIEFLASEKNTYLTGQALILDGGL